MEWTARSSGLIQSFSWSVEMRLLLYFKTEHLRYPISSTFKSMGWKIASGAVEIVQFGVLAFILSRLYTCPCEVWLHAIGSFHPRCWSVGQSLVESRQAFVISKGAAFTDGKIIWPWLTSWANSSEKRSNQWESIVLFGYSQLDKPAGL